MNKIIERINNFLIKLFSKPNNNFDNNKNDFWDYSTTLDYLQRCKILALANNQIEIYNQTNLLIERLKYLKENNLFRSLNEEEIKCFKKIEELIYN